MFVDGYVCDISTCFFCRRQRRTSRGLGLSPNREIFWQEALSRRIKARYYGYQEGSHVSPRLVTLKLIGEWKAKNQHHNNNQVYFQTSIRIQPRPMMQRKHCCIIVYLAALRNNRGDHNVEGLLISPKQLRCKNLEVLSYEAYTHTYDLCDPVF
ncbi:hypothetical protein C5167_002247 [Papaver somniferum]|uniref:Uncharacterized protein n=1 Tax=Papaver somniferum TaxID=3469 RepID=A0A4Y7L138_PAPSO|nr:hypothetical protein C5167_002247 [Papaver somniferum]